MEFLLKLIARLSQRVKSLETIVNSQQTRLHSMRANENLSIHSLEQNQENKVQEEEGKREAMSDTELRVDLEKQYGLTKWSKKLISEILTTRTQKRKQLSDASEQTHH